MTTITRARHQMVICISLLTAICTTTAAAHGREGALPCCTPAEVSTLRDLVYIARKADPPGDIDRRLAALSQALAAGTYRTWTDPDRGLVLGYVARTSDGVYWRALINSFAADIGVTVKTASDLTEVIPSLPSKTFEAGSSISLRAEPYWAVIELNGSDGGLRLLQNFNASGTIHLPWTAIGADSHGAWSYAWLPAADGSSPDQASGQGTGNYNLSSEAAPFYRGQTLVIDGGSQAPFDYATGTILSYKRHVLIASQRPGWPIYFAVSPSRPNGLPENKAVMKLDADGGANPINIVVGGVLRKVVPCTINGMNVLCFQ
ncbi:MAG: hypothetical protein ABR582_13865 [Gemmatimonadaceae bacterium]